MGCDIHLYIEYKCGNGLPWQADDRHAVDKEGNYPGVVAVGRNYKLFGLLASVRSLGPRSPLGLPEDVSAEVNAASYRWGIDGHSHSHMSLEEFKKVLFEEYNQSQGPGETHKYTPTKRRNAFYNWSSVPYDRQPPDFTTVITYCEFLRNKKSIDKQLLGEDTASEVQVRLVFWFDN